MANTGVRLKPEAVREVAFGSLTSSFVALGAPISRPLNEITLINETNAAVYVSLDAVTNEFRISPFSARTLDLKTNDGLFETGQQFYVKYATAPSGPSNSVFAIETLTR
jgi:hypothetical protein